MTLTAWALTTGEAGMRTQARGLARAVADIVEERVVPASFGWPWRPTAQSAVLGPPWPDLVVSCGRRAAPANLRIRALSGGRTLAVHVQDPRGRAQDFDLVIAMRHDRIAAGSNVIKVETALHDITDSDLASEARDWSEQFGALGRPLVGVMVGGDLRGRPFTLQDAGRLLHGLRRLRLEAGLALAITPSRRTPVAVRNLFEDAFRGDPGVMIWTLEGPNPYRAILALADRLVVTSDSVSMVSEALATAHPVEVLDLGFARHAGFIQNLVDRGLVRRFEGEPTPPPPRRPLNATADAAAAVRAILQTRTGVSG